MKNRVQTHEPAAFANAVRTLWDAQCEMWKWALVHLQESPRALTEEELVQASTHWRTVGELDANVPEPVHTAAVRAAHAAHARTCDPFESPAGRRSPGPHPPWGSEARPAIRADPGWAEARGNDEVALPGLAVVQVEGIGEDIAHRLVTLTDCTMYVTAKIRPEQRRYRLRDTYVKQWPATVPGRKRRRRRKTSRDVAKRAQRLARRRAGRKTKRRTPSARGWRLANV